MEPAEYGKKRIRNPESTYKFEKKLFYANLLSYFRMAGAGKTGLLGLMAGRVRTQRRRIFFLCSRPPCVVLFGIHVICGFLIR